MFKFNFIQDDTETKDENLNLKPVETVYVECKEHTPRTINSTLKTELIELDNIKIKHICPVSLLNYLKTQANGEESILKADQNHSDLLPAIYEGGLKVWECTYDVLNYFNEHQPNFKNKLTLDLGCGAGLLGIFTLLNGGTCWFQDYNSDVINNVTIPNVVINSEQLIKESKFFSGDWTSFVDLVIKEYPYIKFDYIVTSETIYNSDYYQKLHLVFEKLLKKDGTIFLAAKSFYFGVGGGVHLFQEFIDSKHIFKYSSCWKSVEGVKREIIKLEYLL